MNYATVCSGIEAPSMAWHSLDWAPQFFSEIEPFPKAVLAHRYPDVPDYGDMTKFKEWPDHDLRLICAGTPCQAFSVAGLRKGLDDPRGNLTLTFLGIVDRYRPEWVVWENVPGVLSIDGGRVFGAFLGGLGQLGYGFAYRVLDAQYFGVPQRRRRVFVVASSRGWQRAAAVLFERESLLRDPAPSRRTGQRVTPPVTASLESGSPGRHKDEHITTVSTRSEASGHARPGDNIQSVDYLIPDVANTLGGASQSGGFRTTDLDNQGAFIPEIANPLTARMHKGVNTTMDEGQTMLAFKPSHFTRGKDGGGQVAVAFQSNYQGKDSLGIDVCGTIRTGSGGKHGKPPAVSTATQVRCLTPRECERLHGFPDDFTAIPWRGKPAEQCPDGPRYKALGNSMAVPVMAWIGRRICMVNEID